MTVKQYIINKDVKLKLFEWRWAATDPEKFRIYIVLLDDFLAKPDIAKIKFRPKVLFYWHIYYCGALQNYIINNLKEKPEIVKHCPLSKREMK